MQMAFYINQSRCIGCYTCVVACKDWHDIPPGAVNWRQVIINEKGKYPDISVSFLSLSCLHCARPSCVDVCPTNAIIKRKKDGIVTINSELCIGKDTCGLCEDVCPYGVSQFGNENGAKMQMCDFCIDRIDEGKKPICVDSCPTRALDAGPLDELRARYGCLVEADGFSYSEKTQPSAILKPKSIRPTGSSHR